MIYKTHQDEIQNYLTDASNFRGNAHQVIIPETLLELKLAVEECQKLNCSLTISGARTGLAGGCVPLEGSVVSTERLNRIVKINFDAKEATVEAGVTLTQLEEELEKYKLFYPPNPTEKNSTIGGNIATNASGSRTFMYGPTRPFIKELDLILASGEQLNLKRGENFFFGKYGFLVTDSGSKIPLNIEQKISMPNIKHAAGYYLNPGMDLIDLFIGSEGSLAVVSQARIQLIDKPANVLGLIIYFDDEENLIDFVEEVREESTLSIELPISSDICARLIEYFDKHSLDFLRDDYPNIPQDAVGAIWVEQEFRDVEEDSILENWYKIISEYTNLRDLTWTAIDDVEHKKMKEFRHTLPLKVTDYLSQNSKVKIATDAAVPANNFRKYYSEILDILQNSGCKYLVYGHIGNSHLHANILPRVNEEREDLLPLYDEMIDIALKYGGTVSAEHGIGKLKKKYLRQMFSDEGIKTMKNIKEALDPSGLLGKGNLF
jgi:D-lactate dehydrogenase (cytochrome)